MYRSYLFILTFILTFGKIGEAVPSATVSKGACDVVSPLNTTLLTIYILAFDNNATIVKGGTTVPNPYNLTQHYASTINYLEQASVGLVDHQAIILADLDGEQDTHILRIYNGTVEPFDCLPNVEGHLDEGIREYDTTDGATLGGFLQWARGVSVVDQTVVSYIGHGLFFTPDVGFAHSKLFSEAFTLFLPYLPQSYKQAITKQAITKQAITKQAITPLPNKLDINPDYTDVHLPDQSGQRLITPYDLATALAIATNNGANPVEVLDVLHCFGASVEELYELHPYAHYTTASPNYAYYGPEMPGDAFAAMLPTSSADQLAHQLLASYDNLIGATTLNPGVALIVENQHFPQLKQRWDAVAAEIMGEFEKNPKAMILAIDQAYTESQKYDTTYCTPSDFLLTPPDALSDMWHFALLLQKYAPTADLATRLGEVQSALFDVYYLAYVHDGTPGFVEPNPPTWTFLAEPFFSLFTPFATWSDTDAIPYHTWQSLWYTEETKLTYSDGTIIKNPHPYQFIQGASATWADVVQTYWALNDIYPGIDVDTAFCTPLFPELIEG